MHIIIFVLALLVSENSAEHDDQCSIHVGRNVDVVAGSLHALRTIDLGHQLASALKASVQPEAAIAHAPIATEADLAFHATQNVLEHDADGRSVATIVPSEDLEQRGAHVTGSGANRRHGLERKRFWLVIGDRRLVRIQHESPARHNLRLGLEANGFAVDVEEEAADSERQRYLLRLLFQLHELRAAETRVDCDYWLSRAER